MKRKTEKAYLSELWGHMARHLEDFIDTGDQESLHQFRVFVKKVRAFLALLDNTSAQNKLTRIFKPIKKIFKHGGKIREAYINIQMSTHYGLQSEDFVLQQVNEIEREIAVFLENSKKYLKTIKAVHGDIDSDVAGVEDDQINEFYKSQLEQIVLLLNRHQFDDDLHEARKRIKLLLYNRKIAAQALEGSLHLDYDYLDKVQNLVGDWHDGLIAIELFSAPGINAKNVIPKIKRRNTRLQKAIKEISANFWKKATLDAEDTSTGQESKVWV